jgi:nicotianamine synthase
MATDIMGRSVLDDKKLPIQGLQSNSDTPPATPTAMSSAAHDLIYEIHDIYNALKELPSLAPSPVVNTLLSRLVELCIQPFSEELARDILSTPEVEALCQSLRPLCATAEGELERYWAGRMLESSSSLIGIFNITHSPF